MALPEVLTARLRLPVIAAPMFLVSGPELVIAASRAGVLASFPTANCRSAAELSRARYDGGVTSYLEVLESERSLFRTELLASATRRQQVVSMVSLYKALGGGWPSEEEIDAAGGFLPASVPPSNVVREDQN